MKNILNELGRLNNAELNSVTESEIVKLNDVSLPSELRELLLLHNGDKEGQSLLGDFKYLMSSTDIVRFYDELREDALDLNGLDCSDYKNSDKRIHPYLWSKKWIPFLLDNDLFYAIDLEPTDSGVCGQVILVVWENNENYWCASSLSQFFEKILNAKKGDDEWPFSF
ncbi:SMI1/KNR4 family protein [Aliikangiella sp. IMCC44359]|uniref:SMI1/KNR4 family protein n=1 Tax=Aliikangiella sp. IMCC44359 TaxID=3459125 RepID=UPI00403B1103